MYWTVYWTVLNDIWQIHAFRLKLRYFPISLLKVYTLICLVLLTAFIFCVCSKRLWVASQIISFIFSFVALICYLSYATCQLLLSRFRVLMKNEQTSCRCLFTKYILLRSFMNTRFKKRPSRQSFVMFIMWLSITSYRVWSTTWNEYFQWFNLCQWDEKLKALCRMF